MNETLKKRIELAVLTYTIVDKSWDKVNSTRTFLKNRLVHTINISSKDYVFDELQRWLFYNCPPKAQRSLVLGTSRDPATFDNDTESAIAKVDSDPRRYKVLKNVDTNSAKHFVYKGYKYIALTTNPDKVEIKANSFVNFEPAKLIITMYSKEAQDVFVDLVKELTDNKQKSAKIVQLMTERYNDWYGKPLITRTLNSVFLPNCQKKRITDDLEQFLAAEADYLKFNMPYHRGYLLHGPPGGGKTSLIKAIASEYKLNIYYLSLSEIKKDSSLIDLIKSVEPHSILLLEDIDVLNVVSDRDSDGDELTLSGLLNALDGVATPHGLIVFATSNCPDKLDDALIRSGRFDVKELLDYATLEQVQQAFQYFYNKPLTTDVKLDRVSLADVLEVVKQNMYSPSAAAAALGRLGE